MLDVAGNEFCIKKGSCGGDQRVAQFDLMRAVVFSQVSGGFSPDGLVNIKDEKKSEEFLRRVFLI